MSGKYQTYPAYKDSGVEWLGEVPEHWNLNRFKNIFRIRKRIAGKLGFNVLSITQKGVKVKDTESGDGQLSMDYSKYQLVHQGDYAMNHMDLLTGFVDISQYDGVTSPDYRVFTLEDKNSNKSYYLYLLQLCYTAKIFYPLGQGAANIGRWRLPSEAFHEFIAPLPNLEEQQKIATFLDNETAKIDKLVEKQQQLLELLKEKISSLVLSATKSTGIRELRLENIAEIVLRPVVQRESELYIPIGIYNKGRGLFHKDPREVQDMGDSDFFWIEDCDFIISGQFAWEGSVALANKENAGRVISHRYTVLNGKYGIALTEYLFAFFLTEHGNFLLNENSRGAAGRNRPLNVSSLMKEKIPVPDIKIQEKIAQAVHWRNSISEEISKQTDFLKERRIALISAAVTGKIDVREWNVL